MSQLFDLQGHRGARSLKPENTLPSFEMALDLGVTSIETDVHWTRDGVAVLIHDAVVSERLCRRGPGSDVPDPAERPLVRSLSLAQLQGCLADRNPDPRRFPEQDAAVTPLARLFAEQHGCHPYAPPTLANLFAFTQAYAGASGQQAGKTPAQRQRAGQIAFDLELKRVPFRPEIIGDTFTGEVPGLLEQAVLDVVRSVGMIRRTRVRSFDHRSVRVLLQAESELCGVVLISGTAPVEIAQLARSAGAEVYAPDFEFLDEAQVRQAHDHKLAVLPWTVNDPRDWQRLLDWGVDGITTDYPDRLAVWLQARGIAY